MREAERYRQLALQCDWIASTTTCRATIATVRQMQADYQRKASEVERLTGAGRAKDDRLPPAVAQAG